MLVSIEIGRCAKLVMSHPSNPGCLRAQVNAIPVIATGFKAEKIIEGLSEVGGKIHRPTLRAGGIEYKWIRAIT